MYSVTRRLFLMIANSKYLNNKSQDFFFGIRYFWYLKQFFDFIITDVATFLQIN